MTDTSTRSGWRVPAPQPFGRDGFLGGGDEYARYSGEVMETDDFHTFMNPYPVEASLVSSMNDTDLAIQNFR